MDSRVVERGLRAGEWDAVVADEDDQRVVEHAGLAQRIDQEPQAAIHAGDGLVELRQFLADLGVSGR